MQNQIKFFVSGHPKAQPRAKPCRRGAFSGVYDPGTADGWKSLVRRDWQALGLPPFTGPLFVSLSFFMARPKAHFRTGKNAHLLKTDAPNWYDKKPDRDNLDKAVLDALTCDERGNTLAWKDDCQVCDGFVRKRWVTDRPGCLIEIRPLSHYDCLGGEIGGPF